MSENNQINSVTTKPDGSLLLRTLAMPGDANPVGDIFGGWIMSQMDIAGSLLARDIANGRVVTAAVEGMSFLSPVKVGDIVCCYGKCVRLGRSSMTISLELWVRTTLAGIGGRHEVPTLVTRGNYIYVRVDTNGKPASLPDDARQKALAGTDASSATTRHC